jgi:hypothetical protein
MPSRKLRCVFAVGVIRWLYKGPPIGYGVYFHSTLEASRFLGYSYDAPGKELWLHRNAGCRGSAILRGLGFITPTEAYRMDDRQLKPHLRRVFPFLFEEAQFVPVSKCRRPGSLQPVRNTGQPEVEQWDYSI